MQKKQILTFSRQENSELKLMKMHPITLEALKFIKSTIPATTNSKKNIQPDCGAINVYPTQIYQIIMNLTTNAYHAMEETSQKITINLKEVELEEPDLFNLDIKQGTYACLKIADTSKGMDNELIEKIFDPFFTTKDVGKGTGLGLATIYGIVKQNNGFINVYSEPDIGTTINVYLPMHEIKTVKDHKESIEEIPISKGETVLVVEDDPSILNIMQKILENLGYTVLTSSAPEKTKDIVKEYTSKIHLLITDVIMPKMNGRDLAEQLQSDCSDLKCIFMSGYTANTIAHNGVLDKEMEFIQKPFSKIDLAMIVRKVLDKN